MANRQAITIELVEVKFSEKRKGTLTHKQRRAGYYEKARPSCVRGVEEPHHWRSHSPIIPCAQMDHRNWGVNQRMDVRL